MCSRRRREETRTEGQTQIDKNGAALDDNRYEAARTDLAEHGLTIKDIYWTVSPMTS